MLNNINWIEKTTTRTGHSKKAFLYDRIKPNVVMNSSPLMGLCLSIRFYEFFHIWPIQQWVSSLVGLVLMYWVATNVYNKRLVKLELGMSIQFRFWMILSDLLLNLVLGLYYLGYRDTLMGQLMLNCPIAVSPVIFVVELLVVILIKEYEIYKISSSSKTKTNKRKV